MMGGELFFMVSMLLGMGLDIVYKGLILYALWRIGTNLIPKQK